MRTKKRGAARRKAAAPAPTKRPPRTRGRASRTAPAAGTAEDPVRAYSSSEYASSSEDEGFEPEPAPRSKRRAATDDELPRKKTKSESSSADRREVYDWSSLEDDVDISAEEALAIEAAERGDSPRNADGAKALPVRDVPPHVFALFARFMAMEREIEVMVEGFPGNVHTSQMRITSLEQLLLLQLINFLCYDPLVKAHPRDGKTLLSNICVVKVQGKKSFCASCEKRDMLATGDAAKATENVFVVDALPVLLPTKENGVPTRPASKFIEICGGAKKARALLQLHVARVALMCRIWELAHGKPLAVASWGENARALVALLGGRVRVLGHHMHPHRALMIYQKNWNALDYVKHIQGSDECLTAVARELGMTVTGADGKIRYWRWLYKNDAAAGEAHSDYRWETSQLRYEGLADACEAKHNHREWWLEWKEPTGPSKCLGVKFQKPSWVANFTIGGAYLHVATCEREDDAAIVADFARVADGREPKNFPEFWNSIKARVEADENCDVPAVARVELQGVVHVNPVRPRGATTVAPLDAAALLEKKIAAALVDEVKRDWYNAELSEMSDEPGSEWMADLPDHEDGPETVGELAEVAMDNKDLAMTLTGATRYGTARKTLWRWKGAAAALFGVYDIGTMPLLQDLTTKERPPEHQRVPDGVTNCSITWLSG